MDKLGKNIIVIRENNQTVVDEVRHTNKLQICDKFEFSSSKLSLL